MSGNIKTKTRNRSYPRSTVKKIIKGHSEKKVGRNVDALVRTGHRLKVAQSLRSPQQVYVDYVLFIQELMRNASRKARASGEKRIAARDIRKVTMSSLRKFKG
ncbi:hypothetical protein EPUS_03797 [Endocarpon pusillum Z07020]|uniref:Transcription factor CBF/NF-Y/archaeal histone domain-containing protein n=1 Tax=Endocarpon pusillum (strain Z07020 / HMAS-L-300199) TaxID=1263415 RepID=U1GNV4_ENDPU|nr:uncharacterized protein EPUS_03797 [Endocarpon pusillum Z07020]ERF73983.1 hypothetical protein EPUS_03797 [Endocarpon pusillum Z07020]